MNIAFLGVNAASAANQLSQPVEPIPERPVGEPDYEPEDDTVKIGASAVQQEGWVREEDAQAQMLKRVAENIIKEQYSQGNELYMLLYGDKAIELDPSLRPEPIVPKYEPEERQDAVVSAIEYFSPENTAGRILKSAEDIAGGAAALRQNPVMNDVLRNAVGAAFVSVQDETGGILPPMSQVTYDIAMRGFESFKAETPK